LDLGGILFPHINTMNGQNHIKFITLCCLVHTNSRMSSVTFVHTDSIKLQTVCNTFTNAVGSHT